MSQGYVVELYFDPVLEKQVQKAWNVLARRKISTQLIEIEACPHIKLLSSPTLDPLKLQNIIRNFAAKQELALTLSLVGSFSTYENVLFLAPTPSLSFLTFHGQLYELLKREGIEAGDNYQPNNWIPHCTVAQDVPRGRMAEAFSILRDFKLPISGYILDIGLVKFSPVRDNLSFPLGNDIET